MSTVTFTFNTQKKKKKNYGVTFIPAIIISDENVSAWPKRPMLGKGSSSNR
jgi:hypothetical protein